MHGKGERLSIRWPGTTRFAYTNSNPISPGQQRPIECIGQKCRKIYCCDTSLYFSRGHWLSDRRTIISCGLRDSDPWRSARWRWMQAVDVPLPLYATPLLATAPWAWGCRRSCKGRVHNGCSTSAGQWSLLTRFTEPASNFAFSTAPAKSP